MTALDPLHPLQSCIVELLAEAPGMTVTEVHARLKERCAIDVSVQNLYRTLSQMIEAQILMRDRGKISLNLVWASHLARFGEQIKKQYLDATPQSLDLPTHDGERKEFFAESLGSLDPIWNHVMLTIAGMYADPEWYEYNSHPWHFLGMTDTEHRLYESLGPHGFKLYGNDSFLDRYGIRMNTGGSIVVTSTETPFPKEGYTLWVCGDYIVDCVYPDILTKHFAFFFQSVRSIEQFQSDLFTDIFRMRAHCKLQVWKSAKESSLLRSKFLPFLLRSPAARSLQNHSGVPRKTQKKNH